MVDRLGRVGERVGYLRRWYVAGDLKADREVMVRPSNVCTPCGGCRRWMLVKRGVEGNVATRGELRDIKGFSSGT
jgi:hypothetical protein